MPIDFIFQQLRPFLFAVDPENAHERMLSAVELVSKFPGLLQFLCWQFREESPRLTTELFGYTLQNPIGLAAGFDKDGRIHPALFALGFGFVEIGTVTPKPQSGNSRPRLFRLVQDLALINRMGFNNQGAWKMAERLVSRTATISADEVEIFNQSTNYPANINSGLLGINIGKNKDTDLDNAEDDYVSALSTLHPFADYFTLNISSPNTDNLRNLQEKEALRSLLVAVCARRDTLERNHLRKTPLMVKLAPDLSQEALENTIQVIQEFSIQGVIATNTTVERPQLNSKNHHETGGLSGKPLQKRSTEMIRSLFQELGPEIPIIGVGGILSGADAYEKIRAGASAVQIYTGLIYQGPGMVRKVKRELSELLKKDAFESVASAVGVDC
ncbi:MAG: quinone-dependent dihydroorotate dehydrogenase [SAR324 cluster bacterium]|nr:quinone-dependent dihydroorotate dehydrogenase [SAR324 cluster bacterium]MBL7035193.1 quinone-dependent dihydroorotate dehydrogenase [SAR324 cluster bacterium]